MPLVTLVLAAFSAHATTIVGATSVVSNTAGNTGPSSDFVYAINEYGLLSGYTSGVTDFDSYIATNPLHTYLAFDQEWQGAPGITSGTVVLDLGAVYDVSGAAVWNEEGAGVSNIVFSTSLDNSGFEGAGFMNVAHNPLGQNYPSQTFMFTTSRHARYIELDLTTDRDILSLGEIAFRADAVPEPTTLAVIGLAMCAGLRKRHR